MTDSKETHVETNMLSRSAESLLRASSHFESLLNQEEVYDSIKTFANDEETSELEKEIDNLLSRNKKVFLEKESEENILVDRSQLKLVQKGRNLHLDFTEIAHVDESE